MAPVEARKQPPPETTEAITLRTKIVFAFWAVIILLGLPTWLRTTSIYRAQLPIDGMLKWAEDVVSQCNQQKTLVNTLKHSLPDYLLPLWVHAPEFPTGEANQVARSIQLSFADSNQDNCLHYKVLVVLKESKDGKIPTDDDRASRPPLFEFELQPSDRPVLEMPVDGNKGRIALPKGLQPAQLHDAIAQLLLPLRSIFEAEHIASVIRTKEDGPSSFNDDNHSHNPQAVSHIEQELSRALKASPVYHLTFSLFTATGAPSSWDIDKALSTHIQPLVRALSKAVDIKIATQVQLYSAFSPSIQAFQIDGQSGHFLKENDLSAFVNAAEWPLSPSVGDGPTLNFIVYIPSKDQMPLKIEGGSQSWLIPQWGAIGILNPDLVPDPVNGQPSVPRHLSADILNPPFETFASQLVSLLGVPSLAVDNKVAPLDLRLKAHQRLTALSLHLRAASSLGSLARLAQHMSSIPIPKHVALLVENAMSNLTASSQSMRSCQWDDAVNYAGQAYQDSEKAFFDKSMVGQVYFPDEHKVAVYLPLLGPIGVPLAVALMREVKRFVASRKATPK